MRRGWLAQSWRASRLFDREVKNKECLEELAVGKLRRFADDFADQPLRLEEFFNGGERAFHQLAFGEGGTFPLSNPSSLFISFNFFKA